MLLFERPSTSRYEKSLVIAPSVLQLGAPMELELRDNLRNRVCLLSEVAKIANPSSSKLQPSRWSELIEDDPKVRLRARSTPILTS
mmetsp:Transcript_1662/g.2660  ORF Transcript_1662/g.2660 Transcript_1662/m.2660 type:complete len:86 (-) Transcript_1662:454-711(-)